MSTETKFCRKGCVLGAGSICLGAQDLGLSRGHLKCSARGSLSPDGLRDGAPPGWLVCSEKRTLLFS